LILGMAAKMAEPLFRRTAVPALSIAAAAFVGVAVMRLSLPLVVLVLAPLSILLAWRRDA
jgi:chromate transporter